MLNKLKNWDEFIAPLYIPSYTAIPIACWLLFKSSAWKDVEIVLLIIITLFLVFAGAVESSSDENKHQFFGYLYLSSSVIFASAGIYIWLL
ncbi:hypothetical protein MUO14_19140 [Halobacillus shinanisalinarum]|uniref:Uncharacterized protein n=1 Tax=Halobacillus shinanisalinarum TaxID=2932258 RepID=A0ABY4H0K6_9BACI|nr:hypothetical protein [Halobacillus shinanisalinarum]UOQ92542.1 hypothetical protein MUO14_19140 [Halobacillus shinanisalinarum]